MASRAHYHWHFGLTWKDIREQSHRHRLAVRALIWRDDYLLMVYSGKNRDYKFPGGGVEDGESLTEALVREVREECGCSVESVGELWGTTTEIRPASSDDPFRFFCMYSHYSVWTINREKAPLQLDAYEYELDMKPVWVQVKTALKANHSLLLAPNKPMPWVQRETRVLERLAADFPG